MAIGLRCLIGVVFLASSVSKLARRGSFAAFASSVRDMRLLPSALVKPVASLVLAAELAVCVLLAMPPAPAAATGLLVAGLLSVIFAVAIAVSARRGVSAACRCFGASNVPLGPVHVVRNLILAVVAAVGAVMTSMASGPVDSAGALVAALAGPPAGAVIILLDDIVELFQPVGKVPRSWTISGRS
ncbi:MauE/DoxX family redox-associated membrane protein [Actinosynnema sp. NPDC023587]|uniref:MauE/DoxX family redox-associated membrane protein n=1 Tax=Actinosynnema sp. NPDC023587 TaxID=3154695 RepID=UPI0033C02B0D